MVMEVIKVIYQQQAVGAASFDTETGMGAFEYSANFLQSGIPLAPLTLPLAPTIYQFPGLSFDTFKGLPGLLADSLPDDFGNAVLNAWAARQGRSPDTITPLQRLQYIGKRGMGALEYQPATQLKHLNATQHVEIANLLELTQQILDDRQQFNAHLPSNGNADKDTMLALLSVGTSAGGARPKAVLAFNDDFTEVRSGQTQAPPGFTHHLLKFDGIVEHNNQKQTFGDPLGYGAMEYVYHLMAKESGIDMMPCRLLEEGKRRHFITQRFDREGNQKHHCLTLNGLAHVDYKKPGSFSYEEVFGIARQLRLPASAAEQLLRRMVFNIVARNHDDHAKNIAFIMQNRQWQLAPAYDLAYSYRPGSKWVAQHWMSLNGKRHQFTRSDIHSLRAISPLFTRKKLGDTIKRTLDAVSRWPQLARQHDVPPLLIEEIEKNLLLDL